jgi:hypothetical protein
MKTSTMSRLCSLLLVFATFQVSTLAWAEDDPRTLSRGHFDQGVEAYNDRRFQEAVRHFEEAYRISPTYEVLYNIAQVNAALGRAVDAVDAYERYLAEGGTALTEDRREQVEKEIEHQLELIGSLSLRVQPDGARVLIDGKPVGQTPLPKPVRLTAGDHTMVVLLKGYDSAERDLHVLPKSQVELEVTLTPVPASAKPVVPPAVQGGASSSQTALASSDRETPPPARAQVWPGVDQRTLGFVLGGTGAVAVAVGGILAATGARDSSDATERMAAAETKPEWETAKKDHDAAMTRNTAGWWVMGAGAGVLLGGVALVLTAGGDEEHSAWLFTPWSSGLAYGASAQAAW